MAATSRKRRLATACLAALMLWSAPSPSAASRLQAEYADLTSICLWLDDVSELAPPPERDAIVRQSAEDVERIMSDKGLGMPVEAGWADCNPGNLRLRPKALSVALRVKAKTDDDPSGRSAVSIVAYTSFNGRLRHDPRTDIFFCDRAALSSGADALRACVSRSITRYFEIQMIPAFEHAHRALSGK